MVDIGGFSKGEVFSIVAVPSIPPGNGNLDSVEKIQFRLTKSIRYPDQIQAQFMKMLILPNG